MNLPRPSLPEARAFATEPLPDGARLAYLRAGSGPGALLIHGSLSDARYWQPQMQDLAQFRTVWAPSLRDYFPLSGSDPSRIDMDWSRDVEDMAAFIAGLGIGPVDVVGHSRGGCIAFHLALRHPRQVRRLVLAEPGGSLGEPAAQPESWRVEAVRHLQAGDPDTALRVFVDSVSRPGSWRFSPPGFRQMARDNAATLIGQLEDPLPAYTPELAKRIQAPVLLVHGQRSPDRFVATVRALQSWLPEARTVEIAGASHGMNLAHPAAFNRAVREFLE